MKKIINILLWVMVVVTMCTIFYFSHQPAKKSSKTSNAIAKKIVNTVSRNKPKSEKKKIEKKVNDTLRTIAHFSLFALLGGLMMAAMITSFSHKKSLLYLFVITLIMVLIYALSDEYHQTFVPGRSAQLIDIIVDFLGGFILSSIVGLIFNKNKPKYYKQ